jgi:hypothetical protein
MLIMFRVTCSKHLRSALIAIASSNYLLRDLTVPVDLKFLRTAVFTIRLWETKRVV